MKKIYMVEGEYYHASTKKEVAEYLGIKPTKIVLEKENPKEIQITDIEYEKRKQRDINDLIESAIFLNKPTRIFEIGEPVSIGRLEGYLVKEIFLDNKIYLIENSEGEYRVVAWQDLFPITHKKTSLFKKRQLTLSFYQTELESLKVSYYRFGIDMNPKYQRDLIWTEEQKIDLIDSIFNDRDIGKFVLVEVNFKENEPGYQILDGKQRLNTLIEFWEDRLIYKGLKYSELSPTDRRNFNRVSISMAKIGERNLTEKKIIEYFIYLNKTGTPVEPKFLKNLEEQYFK